MTSTSASLRILLVNDDGPPSHPASPHVLSFYRTLVARGHKVSVVLPSSQKSWGSMAFSVSSQVALWWYYPSQDEDSDGAWESQRRQVGHRGSEEWVLLDGSPTTCTNVGLFNQSSLFGDASSTSTSPSQRPPFDLVLSGPNFGRNSGLAFCLSSGTLGAALAGAMSGVKSISVSYAHFQKVPSAIQDRIDKLHTRGLLEGFRLDQGSSADAPGSRSDPAQRSALEAQEGNKTKANNVAPSASRELAQIANELTVDLVERLYSQWEDEVGVYGINIPLAWTLQEPKVYWTHMWQNSYPRLFSLVPPPTRPSSSISKSSPTPTYLPSSAPSPITQLTFKPEMTGMLSPLGGIESDEGKGTDVWALMNGWVSVTRVQARYSECEGQNSGEGFGSGEDGMEGRRWRL